MDLDGVTLPDNVYISDAYAWEPVAQSAARTLGGGRVVEEVALSGGRPITLAGMWVTRATVNALEALRAQTVTPMTLTLPGGELKQVLWRRGEGALEARPLFPKAPDVLTESTTYSLTLRLMEA